MMAHSSIDTHCRAGGRKGKKEKKKERKEEPCCNSNLLSHRRLCRREDDRIRVRNRSAARGKRKPEAVKRGWKGPGGTKTMEKSGPHGLEQA